MRNQASQRVLLSCLGAALQPSTLIIFAASSMARFAIVLSLLASTPYVHAGLVRTTAGPTGSNPFVGTVPYASLATLTSPLWTTVPPAQRTGDPFCENEADPDNNIGNFCVCKNGATLENIPHGPKTPQPNYQPCAYTTVPPRWGNSTSTTARAPTGSGITWSPAGHSGFSRSRPLPSGTGTA